VFEVGFGLSEMESGGQKEHLKEAEKELAAAPSALSRGNTADRKK